MADKLHSINEKEARDAVHAALEKDGVKVTKKLVDQVMDKASDLSFNALVAGKAIKIQDLGTLEVRAHAERDYVLPNGDKGTAPEGFHVKFVESEKLKRTLNTTEA
jgi:nucleoid DNA-binding protein